MGIPQSNERSDEASSSNLSKKCYYDVLGVERLASSDDIKKAFRRKALELHPDRNFGDTEAATAKFAEVQTAYEILSDSQERAWYDSHRESILRDEASIFTEKKYDASVKYSCADDIASLISKFNRGIPFTDAADGFFGACRQIFSTLAKEENSACSMEGLMPVPYPDFGMAKDDYINVVKPFYQGWQGFSTQKTFTWRHRYRLSDAPDRATRRIFEKENKRLQDDGIMEFNQAVRNLVAFTRKRDPRYIPNSQTEEDRQKLLRSAAAAQAARSKAANKAKLADYVLPEWAKAEDPEDIEENSNSEDSKVECIECVVCKKVFKSEKQYEVHEMSKKHIKAVRQLRREMKDQSEFLNLDESSNTILDTKIDFSKEIETPIVTPDEKPLIEDEILKDETPKIPDLVELNSDIQNLSLEETHESSASQDESIMLPKIAEDHLGENIPKKIGKAKLKRAKKKAKENSNAQQNSNVRTIAKNPNPLYSNIQQYTCKGCHETYVSRTKLFLHIKTSGHAQPL
ncbi:DnaJ domain containing protein/putative transcription factor/C2H2 finger domain protein [Blumeria hordei DH14]|uniref:DnaJ domain containing protein/putative transcription factor/C2H2 finger domain protein n=1 Tax=Blumeria graminis f. sp. hordei (strain DH14) TaxID=546991 RepID=N1JQW8_BLUG1|nr:DnaJ domain containing protein/putative transcription factor/C2H2 finger domain protein [Blumeria hordei DH14]